MTDVWYREYLAVAAQLDKMTEERDSLRARLTEAGEALELVSRITTHQNGKLYAPIMRARATLDKIRGGDNGDAAALRRQSLN